MAEVELIGNGQLALGRGKNIMAVFGNDKVTHTKKELEDQTSGDYAKWGDDNRFPQNLHEALAKNGAAGSGLRLMRATHYGQGFHLYTNEVDEKGKTEKKMVDVKSHKEVHEFFQRNKITRFWTEKITDLETFNLAMPEYILSNDFNKVVSLRRLQTAKCRYEKINESTGLIDNIYYCHDWKSSTSVDSEYVAKIPIIDSYWSAEQIKEYCKKKRIWKFVIPRFYPLLTETYYPNVDWHSVFHNGWLDVANSIPKYKKHLFENQLNVKYMVYISEEYFIRQYGDDWDDFKPDKKIEIRKELTKAIDEHLSGEKNAGKSIHSVVYKDSNGEWVKGIEVVPIDDKLKDGAYLPEATAANSEIMFAIGADPSLLGAGIPGGKMNTGSGSDKREAFSILNSLFKTKREITLETWYFLRDYNGWDESLEGDFASTTLTTLDKNPTGTENQI